LTTSTNKKFKYAFAIWWFTWALLHYGALRTYGLNTLEAFSDSFISNMLLAGCCLLIINNMRYYLPRQENYWYVLIISGGLACVWLIAIVALGLFS